MVSLGGASWTNRSLCTVPHNLGADAAKSRVSKGFERARTEYLDKLGSYRGSLVGAQGGCADFSAWAERHSAA